MTAQVVGCYSETGGIGKTTAAVSIAMAAARSGLQVVLIDLDPRGATTKWLGIEPREPGLDMSAILADPDPVGWVEDMAVHTARDGHWHPNLLAIPSGRALGRREREPDAGGIGRLATALQGNPADVVVVDFPNRPGGYLVLNGLEACDDIVYPAMLTEDGLDGVDGAVTTVRRYLRARAAERPFREAGVLVTQTHSGAVMSRHSKMILAELIDAYGDLVLEPHIPNRVIVSEAKAAKRFYGEFGNGVAIAEAYDTIVRTHLIHSLKERAA